MEKDNQFEKNINGEIMTGYPHIDKPWMKYYDKNLDVKKFKGNPVDYLKKNNLNRKSNTAESYYGRKFSYDEILFDDTATKVLNSLGVKKGDIILNLVPNIPEAGELWRGATNLGAVSDFIDPRPDSTNLKANAQKLLEIIKFEKPKFIVALDMCYLGMLKPIENELKELGINKIVILSASDSMNLPAKIDYLKDVINYNELKNIRTADDNTINKLKWYQALKSKMESMKKTQNAFDMAIKDSPLEIYKYNDLKNNVKYAMNYVIETDENLMTYVGHTSGTSGARPKPIPVTNKNIISKLQQFEQAGMSINVGDKILRILPLFAPFGAFDNYMINLSYGAVSVDVPEFDMSEIGYLLKKYQPNIIIATPSWLSSLPKCKYLEKMDLSFIEKMVYGGDSMPSSEEEKLNTWLKEHGSEIQVRKGYGMSEFIGDASYAKNEYNKYGTIGIPLPMTTFGLVDPNIEDKLVPLKFEDGKDRLEGELVVSGDTVTDGVFNDNIIVPHYELDGKSYIRTRDIAQMDRDGLFYHMERKDRSFTRFDGFKYKPHEIEPILEKHPDIEYARVVEYYDDKYKGYMPICHLLLNKKYDNEEDYIKLVEDIVNNYIVNNPNMSSRHIPTKFKIRASMPFTKNSKIDFNALKKEGLDGTEINVDIDESILTVGNINIYKNKQNTLKLK